MTYSVKGAQEQFELLNGLLSRERASEAGPRPASFAYLTRYEEYLFPDDPELRTDPEEAVARAEIEPSLLGRIGRIDDPLIRELHALPISERLKLALPLKRYANHRSVHVNRDRARLRELVAKALAPFEETVVERIGGNFAVVRVDRMITKAGASDKSEAWHFDPTPIGFYKLFYYLDGSESHDGATEYLSQRDSARLIRANYHNVPLDERASQVSQLPVAVTSVERADNKGEVLLFNPALLCHRGCYPTRGQRNVFSISILRSPVPWRETFDEVYDIAQMTGSPSFTTWPRWRS